MKKYHGRYVININGQKAVFQVHTIGSAIELSPISGTKSKPVTFELADRSTAGSLRNGVLVVNTATKQSER